MTCFAVSYIGNDSIRGMLEMEDMDSSQPKYTSNVAFMAGSSKQGKAFLAAVAWKLDTAIRLYVK